MVNPICRLCGNQISLNGPTDIFERRTAHKACITRFQREERAGFLQQIEASKENVRRLKTTLPHILPEWQELKAAEAELLRAQERLARAKLAWKEL